MFLFLIYNKNEALDAFKIYKVEVEKQIKIVRSNKDGEYYGRYMGSRQKRDPFETMFGTPQSNDGAEKQNRTLLDVVRSMNSNFNLPLSLWSETLKNYCVYLK